MKPAKILHLHSTFTLGGKEARAVRLMNHFGKQAEHVILSAEPQNLSARDAIDPKVKVAFPDDAPSLAGKPSLSRYRDKLAKLNGFAVTESRHPEHRRAHRLVPSRSHSVEVRNKCQR